MVRNGSPVGKRVKITKDPAELLLGGGSPVAERPLKVAVGFQPTDGRQRWIGVAERRLRRVDATR